MLRIKWIIAGLLISICAYSQEIAVTERGDSVVLFSSGKWDYLENYRNSNLSGDDEEITMSSKLFSKPKSSVSKISGKNNFYELYYNDKKWKRVPPESLNPVADIALHLTTGDVYCMAIFEELEIPVENLARIALDNAISAAPDIKLVEKEYRVVNGDTLIYMRMDGTYSGIKISYCSYYYSNTKGTLQLHTFTGQALLNKFKSEIDDLLNGLVIVKGPKP